MTSKLVLVSRDRALEVVFEPFYEVHPFPANSVMTVTLKDDEFDDELEIVHSDGRLTLWVFGKSDNNPEKLIEVSARTAASPGKKEPPIV